MVQQAVKGPGQTRVMVVEDDPSSRFALDMLIKHHGFQTVTAATVHEAIDRLATNPCCMVLDLMLPDGSGIDVMRAIAQRNLPVRVAVLTGANDPDLLRDAQQFHPNLLLRKPVDLSKLLTWLDACSV